MSYAPGKYQRSKTEILFLVFFPILTILGYSLYKWPQQFVAWGWIDEVTDLYFLGKSTSFWYSFIFTAIVCVIAGKVVLAGKAPYKKGKKNQLSKYQRNKFISIFICQILFFFIIPFVIPPLVQGRAFFADPVTPISRDAYIYLSRGFLSWPAFAYIFILVPLSVYFFGKRYCSWFCACGNLAETIGVTKWGAAWVKHKTPTGKTADRLESLQTVFMLLSLLYGFILFLDLVNIFTAPNLMSSGKFYNDFIVDFVFGALIGIGFYPFFGTRVWCRYGCPIAKMMELFGRHVKSRFQIAANSNCKGLNLCSQVCPMGIDVASYAHKDKKPLEGHFGLKESPCIGCGGCIDICPVDALAFSPQT